MVVIRQIRTGVDIKKKPQTGEQIKLIDYRRYIFSPVEALTVTACSVLIPAAIAFIFYRSIVALVALIPLGVYIFRKMRGERIRKRAYELNLEFREAIMSVQTALNAGYSVENAFIEAGHEMEVMYGPEAMITTEFRMIERRLRSNENVERIVMELAERSGLEDIRDFADVFIAAKRSGGDLSRIIRRTADTISDKIEVRREIETLLSAKRMENRIMQGVPFFIIAYLSAASPEFIAPLYHNVMGIGVMTFCLVLYAVAFLLSEKIIDIRV